MKIVRTRNELRALVAEWRARGKTLAVVPTMGALHEGHLTLVRTGLDRADHCLVTIFVNPTQFAAHEDLGRYPREEEADFEQLRQARASAVYAPDVAEIYPPDFSTTIYPSGAALAGLEDKVRPHFYSAVATVVMKLLNQTSADFALFGEKDYQQLQVITQTVCDLDCPTEIIPVPVARDADGLALSSRNRFLSRADRQRAPALFRALSDAAEKIRAGMEPSRATATARRALSTQGFVIDYIAARQAKTLKTPVPKATDPLVLLGAVRLGTIRLIDAVPVCFTPPDPKASAPARVRTRIIRQGRDTP